MPTIPLALSTLLAAHLTLVSPNNPQELRTTNTLPSGLKLEVLVTINQVDPKLWRSGLKPQVPLRVASIKSPKVLEGADAVWLEDENGMTVVVEGVFLRRQSVFHDLLLAEEVAKIFQTNKPSFLRTSLDTKDRLSELLKNALSVRNPEYEVTGDLNTRGTVMLSPCLNGTLYLRSKEHRVNYDGADGEQVPPIPFRATFLEEQRRKEIQNELSKPILVTPSGSAGTSLNLVDRAGRSAAQIERRLWELAGWETDDALRITKRKTDGASIPYAELAPWKQVSLQWFVLSKFKNYGFKSYEEGLEGLKASTFKESFSGFAIRYQTDADQQYLKSPIIIPFSTNSDAIPEVDR